MSTPENWQQRFRLLPVEEQKAAVFRLAAAGKDARAIIELTGLSLPAVLDVLAERKAPQ